MKVLSLVGGRAMMRGNSKARTVVELGYRFRFRLLEERGSDDSHEPKLLSPDIFWWGRGLPHEGVGAKKFGMSLETREITLLWWDIPGFCWDIPAVPEKFEKKSLCSIFGP